MAKKSNYSGKKTGSMYSKGKKRKGSNVTTRMIDKRRKNSGCFVSTVCFGESAIETQIFRNWRDNYLLHRNWGKIFVLWYYENGEKLSKKIVQFEIARVFVSYLLSKFAYLLGKRYR